MTIARRIGSTLALTLFGLTTLWLMLALPMPALGQDGDPNDSEEETPVDICAVPDAPNLLTNPSFEGEYSTYVPPNGHPDCSAGVCTTAQIPRDGDWEPFWRSHDDDDDPWIIRMPEYKPVCPFSPCPFPSRLHEGEQALQYFSFFSTHEAGMYQQVAATEGSTYCFSAYGHSWHSESSSPPLSDDPNAFLWQKVGIDPTGGTDYLSPNIIWSDQDSHPNGRSQFDEYGLFVITGTAQAPTVTVFFYSQPQFAKKHNDVYWDDTRLTEIATAPVSPTITAEGSSDIAILTTLTETKSVSRVVTLSVAAFPISDVTWQATISPGNSITPSLSALSGPITTPMTITVTSSGLPTGTYAADVVVTTAPAAQDGPITIPIRVAVADRIYSIFAPYALNE